MRPNKLLVFDLETVPDTDLARALNPEWRDLEDIAVRAKLSAAALERSGGRSDFLAPPYHRIVAIGCLMADVEALGPGREAYHFRKFGCIQGEDEGEILGKFLEYGGRERTLLVSFNGVQFDLPVVRLRALKHKLACRWLFLKPDKWKHYFENGVGFHDDLMIMLGGRDRLKMNEVAKMAGLPGKLDIDGSWVADLAAEGDLQKVKDYCETDVMNTYLLYLRHQHLIGVLDEVALEVEENRLREELAGMRDEKEHWAAFLDAWPEQDRGAA